MEPNAPRTNYQDYKTPTGQLDWKALAAARIANGENCSQCNRIIVGERRGLRQLCGQCRNIAEPGELRHSSIFRCPSCRHTSTPERAELYELYDDGEHEITCDRCDHTFSVETHVSYTFTSPAVLPAAPTPEPEEDDAPTAT